MIATSQAAIEIETRGYVVVRDVYSAAECQRARTALDGWWSSHGGDGCGGEFGMILHPMLALLPGLAWIHDRPEMTDLIGEILGDEPRLAHSGGLISDRSRSFTPWHCHRDEFTDPAAWPRIAGARVDRVRRLLVVGYIDGSLPELGELLVLPRAIADPLEGARGERLAEWPGQQVVTCPPGSVVIFDQNLWHAARGLRGPGRRRLLGGHYQGWSDPASHREDQRLPLRQLAPTLGGSPTLARLVLPPLS